MASRPAAANPTAVEPNDLIERNASAAASSSSSATSGITLSWAGSKNWATAEFRRMITYSQATPNEIASGIDATSAARSRSDAIMILLRSKRSTKTPATRPKTRLGTADAMRISPTARAESVSRKTTMAAARSVSD